MPSILTIIIVLVGLVVVAIMYLIYRINSVETTATNNPPVPFLSKRFIVRTVHVDHMGNTLYYLIHCEYFGTTSQVKAYVRQANAELMNTPGYDTIRGLGRNGCIRYDYILDNEQ